MFDRREKWEGVWFPPNTFALSLYRQRNYAWIVVSAMTQFNGLVRLEHKTAAD